MPCRHRLRTRSCKVAVEGKHNSNCSLHAGCCPVPTSTVSPVTPKILQSEPCCSCEPWLARCLSCPPLLLNNPGLGFYIWDPSLLFHLISRWEQISAFLVWLKLVLSTPVLLGISHASCARHHTLLSETLVHHCTGNKAGMYAGPVLTPPRAASWVLERSSTFPQHREEDPLLLRGSLGPLCPRMC